MKRMQFSPRQLKALDQSIVHWTEVLQQAYQGKPNLLIGPRYCACCEIWRRDRRDEPGCDGCPIAAYTGKPGCKGTPHQRVVDAEQLSFTANSPNPRVCGAVRDELAFLLRVRKAAI